MRYHLEQWKLKHTEMDATRLAAVQTVQDYFAAHVAALIAEQGEHASKAGGRMWRVTSRARRYRWQKRP